MPLLRRYTHLKKKDPATGTFRLWEPLRAVGLAVELGLKKASSKGLGKLTCDDVSRVRVCGDLQLFMDGAWHGAGSCMFALRAQDAELSLAVVRDFRTYFHQKGFCPSALDVAVPGVRCSMDLVGDTVPNSTLEVHGKLWVETKVFSEDKMAKQLELETERLEKLLPRVQAKMPHIEAVWLVCVAVDPATNERSFTSQILSSGGWRNVSVKSQVSRGKPWMAFDFLWLWEKMEWHRNPAGGPRLGQLSEFLKALRLPWGSPGKRAMNINRRMAASGESGRLVRVSLGKAGSKPWVGSKTTFRQASKYL